MAFSENLNFKNKVASKTQNSLIVPSTKGVQINAEMLCNPETTHVVAQKMSRSEKMLGSIASGKWILHPSYIEACMVAKEILSNFTDFEWGNPEKGFMQEISAKEQQLAKTAFR